MTALLNDLSYIPPNNEHNDPTHRDIGKTSNEPTQDTHNELEELYANANEELCPNGNKDLDFCPVCNTSRWKYNNTQGKKVPKKVLRYFLIIPRLQRLYKSSHTAKEMISHATGKCMEPVKMQHPVDGRAWKKFDTKYLDFEKEPRNVRQRLAIDGFNPFGNLSQAYSLWPVILTTYNLPSWLCMKDSSFMLTLLIPSPKSQGKDIDVYLRPLIEDLKVLWDRKAILVRKDYKTNNRAMFLVKANLLCSFDRDDMLKAQIKVVDILYDLELIYSHTLFDIMIHLVIYLPLEALEGGPIRPRWMFPFERHMKKPKGYVRNKSKPEGSIAEGYVAKEALTFNNDKDPEVSTTSELFTLAYGPTWTPISINSCVVYGVRYVVHSRDERRITQNNGICLPGPDGEMYYGQLQEILEFKFLLLKVMLFRVKWSDTQNQGRKVKRLVLRNNLAQSTQEAKPHWKVVEHVIHKKFSDEDVIMVEDDPDIIHFENSSDLPLSTSLNDLDNETLHIDGQSMEVNASPNIIDVFYEDDDIIDDEDALPHDLADYDVEDLINVDDDGVDKMSADVARSHGGDDGGKDRPPPHYVPSGCEGFFANRGKGKRKPNLGGRAAGRMNTRDKTQNLLLKEIMNTKGPVSIGLSCVKKKPLCLLVSMRLIGLATSGRNITRAAQNRQNRVKSMVISRQGSRSLALLRDEMRQSSTTQEYPSLIDTFFVAHTVNEEFLRDKDRRIYEMRRLEAMGTYTDDEINILARGGKQLGHIPGVGRVFPAPATASPSTLAHESTLNSLDKKLDFMMSLFKIDSKYSDMFSQFESGGGSGSDGCKDDEEGAEDQDDEDEDGNGDT
nr:hypothetical protein [Tanacetum cinerariifolium]